MVVPAADRGEKAEKNIEEERRGGRQHGSPQQPRFALVARSLRLLLRRRLPPRHLRVRRRRNTLPS